MGGATRLLPFKEIPNMAIVATWSCRRVVTLKRKLYVGVGG